MSDQEKKMHEVPGPTAGQSSMDGLGFVVGIVFFVIKSYEVIHALANGEIVTLL